LYIGKVLLGYPEKEVWHMTLRKIALLHIEHQKENGTYEQPQTLDEAIPF